MTQANLAEKLNITDRAISKWENGKGMPDTSIMLELCENLNITVNELLNGEEIKKEKFNEKTEELLLEMARKEEIQNKKLIIAMWTILIVSTTFYIISLMLTVLLLKEGIIFDLIICGITLIYLVSGFIALKFEVDAGFYECKNCHYKFIPKYKEVIIATHMGTIRHLKCPKCNKKCWDKKVLRK